MRGLSKKVLGLIMLSSILSSCNVTKEPKAIDSVIPEKHVYQGDISDTDREKWINDLTPVKWISEKPKALIKNTKGYPEIFIGGKPLPVLSSYFGYIYDDFGYTHKPREFHEPYGKKLAAAGILDNMFLPISITVPDGNVDFSRARQIFENIRKINPDAKFILRCYIYATPEFATKYPGDVVLFEDGTANHWKSRPRIKAEQTRYSFASRNFERECVLGMRTLLENLKHEQYAENVYALVISIGETGEWNVWQGFDTSKHAIDYCPAMQRRFEQFVRKQYKNSQNKLRAAWEGQSLKAVDISLPGLAARGHDEPSSLNESIYKVPGTIGYFRNPGITDSQKVCDYYDCLNRETSERLSYLCRAVGKLSGNALLSGGFLGGPLTIAGYHVEGQCAFNEVLNSPYINIIFTPWTYQGRSLGGNLFFRMPLQSMNMKNKIYWSECDTRTSLSVNKKSKSTFGAADSPAMDIERLKMDLIRLVTTNAYGYWFEMFVGWYAAPEHQAIMKKIADIGTFAAKCDRSRNSEIAVFYDEKSIYYMSEWLNYIINAKGIMQNMGFIGADYDIYSTNDIRSIDMKKYKLLIFPNFAYADASQRKELEQYAKGGGRTILWLYGSGLINPDNPRNKCDAENMQDLTGFKTALINKRMSPQMKRISNSANKEIIGDFSTPDITSKYKQAPLVVFPQFFIDDPAAKVEACYLDSGKVGFATKEMDTWRSVYFGSPAISSGILRKIAQDAGVHIYLDTDDLLYHNKSFIGVQARTAGKKTIYLPEKSDIYDLFNDKVIGNDISEFTLDMKKHETALFHISKNAARK